MLNIFFQHILCVCVCIELLHSDAGLWFNPAPLAFMCVSVWKLFDHSLQIGFCVRYATQFSAYCFDVFCAKTLIAPKWLDVDINTPMVSVSMEKWWIREHWMIHWTGPTRQTFDYVQWMKFMRTSKRKGQPLISIALDSRATVYFFSMNFSSIGTYESFEAIDSERKKKKKTLLVLIKNINWTLFLRSQRMCETIR